MDIGELGRALLRRWYIVLAGLLATVGLGVAAVKAVPPQYEAAASALVYRPTSVLGDNGNPFVALGGLEAARDVVLKSINDPSVLAELTDNGRQDLEVVADAQSSAPIISITVTADAPSTALTMQAKTLDLVPKTLAQLQAGLDVSRSAQIASVDLSRSAEPVVNHKSQLRVLVAAVGAGIVLTILLALAIDRFLRRRPRATSATTGSEQTSVEAERERASQPV